MSRDPRLAILRRELAALRSEKTIVLAIAIQLFVAAFSSFLVVGLVSMYDPASVEGGGIAVGVGGDAEEDLIAAAEGVEGAEIVRYESAAAVQEAFVDGRVDTALVTTRSDDGQLQVRATVPRSGAESTVIVAQLRETLRTVEETERARMRHRLDFDPLPLPPEGDASPYFGFTYTVLVPLLLFLPVFVSGSIAVDSISEEIERGTLEVLRAAPVSLSGIVDAKLAATAGLAPVQAALWLALLWLNGIPVSNVPALLALTAAAAVGIVTAGLAIALAAPDRRQGQLLYSVCVLAAFVVAGFLPEHPANTVAKLAIGSPSATTWVLAGAYVVAGLVAFFAARTAIARLDPERLGRTG